MPTLTREPGTFRRAARARAGAVRLFAAAFLALAPGCGAKDTLEGSLGEILPMDFKDVEVAVTDTEVVVSYFRPNGPGRDVVLKLVVNDAPPDVPPGQYLDLSPRPDGTANAVCTRAVANDPIHTLAAVRTGELKLSAVPVVDQPVSGEFRVTLGEGGDAGRGRTAFGTFSVTRVVHGS